MSALDKGLKVNAGNAKVMVNGGDGGVVSELGARPCATRV